MILLDSDGLPFLNGTRWILVYGLLIFLKREFSIIDMSFAMEQKIIYVIMSFDSECNVLSNFVHHTIQSISFLRYRMNREEISPDHSQFTKPKKNVESAVLLFQHKNPPSKPSTSNLSKSKKNLTLSYTISYHLQPLRAFTPVCKKYLILPY